MQLYIYPDGVFTYGGNFVNNKKHGQGFEYVGDGILIGVNYQNGVKINCKRVRIL